MDDALANCRIDPAQLKLRLAAAGDRFAVEALPECLSTSTLLLERARQGAPSGALLVADRQTAGRVRRVRSLCLIHIWMCIRDRPYKDKVAWHQRNVEAIRKEISNLR